jgi:carbon storage regulator
VLVLTRRLHESIVIPGSDVTIRVVAVKGGNVRISIEAPPDVPIRRGELLDPSQAVAREGPKTSNSVACNVPSSQTD